MSSAFPCSGYDIIGDLHGHHDILAKLLRRMGYHRDGDGWRHPERQAVFVGDLIDRGPQQLETLGTVRAMVEDGNALCILGNHEFNAIAYFLKDADGRPLRPLGGPRDPHRPFLQAVGDGSARHEDWISWFRRLPLWYDLDGLSVIHACRDAGAMRVLKGLGLGEDRCLPESLLRAATIKGSPAHAAIETLCKGPEIPLPEGHAFADKDGKERRHIRVRWWAGQASSYRDLALVAEDILPAIPETPLAQGLRPISPPDPVVVGHYWLSPHSLPAPLAARIACVDYSAGKGGPLVAYRWNRGETRFRQEQFVACRPKA